MGFHTFPVERADDLDDVSRYASLSVDELVFALDPDPEATVADLGSGVGFDTDDVAPFVGRVYAVDVQSEMHEVYRERGIPENVDLVTAGVDDLPFTDDDLDAAFSTMTYHEFYSEAALADIARVLRPDGNASCSPTGPRPARGDAVHRSKSASARPTLPTTSNRMGSRSSAPTTAPRRSWSPRGPDAKGGKTAPPCWQVVADASIAICGSNVPGEHGSRNETGFDDAYDGTPPWDIGRPQREVVRLAEAGEITGDVLDVGCGTGENSLWLAEQG